MNTQPIIDELEAERDRLEAAISVLKGGQAQLYGVQAVPNIEVFSVTVHWQIQFQRKELLRKVIEGSEARFMRDFPGHNGIEFYEMCCNSDLEGVVAKRLNATYTHADHEVAWVKIKNTNYSQNDGRGDLFNLKAPGAKAPMPQFKCGGY